MFDIKTSTFNSSKEPLKNDVTEVEGEGGTQN